MKYALEIYSDRHTLCIHRGSISVLFDPRGEHSKRLLHVVSGLRIDTSIRIKAFGTVLDHRRLAYLSPSEPLKGTMTVKRKFQSVCKSLKLSNPERSIQEADELLHLSELFDRPLESLSNDQMVWVKVAMTLFPSPDLLLLNHFSPFQSLLEYERFLRMLVTINKKYGVTIVIATNDLRNYLDLADRIFLYSKDQWISIDDALLEERSARYIEISASPLSECTVLLDQCSIPYKVSDEGKLSVEELLEPYELNEKLVKAGIKVHSIHLVEKDLAHLLNTLGE
ncbi:hypothetical protein [Guggenheimella bovis]